MKSSNLLLKVAALSSFILLMTGFVAYKAGVLKFQSEENSSVVIQSDTIENVINTKNSNPDSIGDSLSPTFFSSSKSIILLSDTNGNSEQKQPRVDSFYFNAYLGSSKSSLIVPVTVPNSFPFFNFSPRDTIKLTTQK